MVNQVVNRTDIFQQRCEETFLSNENTIFLDDLNKIGQFFHYFSMFNVEKIIPQRDHVALELSSTLVLYTSPVRARSV